MPIYEYQCSDCRQTFEVRRCFSDSDKPASCSNCESLHTHRVLSNFYAQSSGQPSLSSTGHSGCSGCGGGGSCGSCHH